MFTYGAADSEWQKLVDLAAAQGYIKFYVTDYPRDLNAQKLFLGPKKITFVLYRICCISRFLEPDDIPGGRLASAGDRRRQAQPRRHDLPHFWEKFIDYVAAMKGTDRMVTPASDGAVV